MVYMRPVFSSVLAIACTSWKEATGSVVAYERTTLPKKLTSTTKPAR